MSKSKMAAITTRFIENVPKYPQEADMECFCINVVFLDSASPLAGFRLFLLSTMSKYNMAAIKEFF